jgi:hypothetical protein
MSSGEGMWRDLEGRLPSWRGLERADLLLPKPRDLATSAIEVVTEWVEESPLVMVNPALVSPLSSSAMRADRLQGARLREMVVRERDLLPLLPLVELPLVEVLRAGFEFLPRPRPRPLCI